jgi:alkylation response protein AidB-like acyl-CoA dehydrogenase
MFHERMLYNSPLVTLPVGTPKGGSAVVPPIRVARDAGTLDDPVVRAMVGEARMLEVVGQELQRRIADGVACGAMSDQSAAIGRAFWGFATARTTTISFDIAGGAGAAWFDDDGDVAERGTDFLIRQTTSIGGGTVEMARNVISERVLGMPREPTLDRDVPFRDVPRNAADRA